MYLSRPQESCLLPEQRLASDDVTAPVRRSMMPGKYALNLATLPIWRRECSEALAVESVRRRAGDTKGERPPVLNSELCQERPLSSPYASFRLMEAQRCSESHMRFQHARFSLVRI
jgi:hypothetical protein